MKKFIYIMAAAPLLLSAENVIENVRENVVNVQDKGSTINSGIDLGDKKGTLTGNGKKATVKRDVSSFDSVSAGGGLVVNIKIDNYAKSGLEITADSNITDSIGTNVQNGLLTIAASKSYSSENHVSVTMTVPSLKNIICFGACELTVTGKIADLSAELSGAAKLYATGLEVGNLTVDATGAAYAEVSVSGVLTVTGSGAAKVLYEGSPSKINKELSGVASLENME